VGGGGGGGGGSRLIRADVRRGVEEAMNHGRNAREPERSQIWGVMQDSRGDEGRRGDEDRGAEDLRYAVNAILFALLCDVCHVWMRKVSFSHTSVFSLLEFIHFFPLSGSWFGDPSPLKKRLEMTVRSQDGRPRTRDIFWEEVRTSRRSTSVVLKLLGTSISTCIYLLSFLREVLNKRYFCISSCTPPVVPLRPTRGSLRTTGLNTHDAHLKLHFSIFFIKFKHHV